MGRDGGAAADSLELLDIGATGARREAGSRADDATKDFETFYRREYTGLLVLARVLAGPSVAEDVAQEAMLVVYRKWDDVQRLSSPVGWARSVCMHKAVSLARRRSVEQRVLRQLGSFRSPERDTADDHERFWALVRRLPLRQAQVVALHYAVDLGISDIATTLGCADGTVKAHLSRARTALAEALATEEEVER